MALIDTRASRVLFTTLLFAVCLAFLYLARYTLVTFLFAVFFAYLIEPLVSRLQTWTRTRARAIAVIYLGLILLLGVFFAFVGPRIARQSSRLTETVPSLLERVSSGQIAVQIGSQRGWSYHTQEQLKNILAQRRAQIAELASRAGIRIAELVQNSWWIVLIPILAVFFLKDGRTFTAALLGMVPSHPQREFLEGVINDMNAMLAQFIRAQLTMAALALVVYLAVLSILRVPYALLLGTAGGVLEFIPVVGPFIAGVLILGIAFLMSYPHLSIILLFLVAWRLTQDYLTGPRIMGRSVQLHPLAAIFGVLAGGELAGVIGVFLSIPIMASLRIVFQRWKVYADKKKFGPLETYVSTGQIRP